MGKEDLDLLDNEEQYRESLAEAIATQAAQHVAEGMERVPAIKKSTEQVRQRCEAEADITGVAAANLPDMNPSKVISPQQVYQIKQELMDAARNAADTF